MSFKWQYTGNMINLITCGLVFLSLLFLRIQKSSVFFAYYKVFMRLLIIGVIGISLGKIFIMFPVPFPTMYLFEQPARRLFVGAFFLTFQITQLMIFLYCAFLISGRTSKILFRAFVYCGFILAIGLGAVLIHQSLYRNNEEKYSEDKYEVGLVFGAAVWPQNKPSPVLVARLQKVIELYQNKTIQKIQLTGANAPGEQTEAKVARKYLDSYALPDSIFLPLEEKSTSTSEQIRFVKNDLLEKHKYTKVALISDNYHAPRIDEVAKFYNLTIPTFAAEIKLSGNHDIMYKLREGFALLMFWLFGV